ncbi:TolB family protein [Agarilytica rhodophyticola]|uniref:TolB family protein n=1 Tax=Agarilytica rhodophyticola TaxID=1737490 RepID=UPI000B342B54|nr:PD40 domain-containing protein [Agarilytica rhodophyticola]
MKNTCISIVLLLNILVISSMSYSRDKLPTRETHYLGQKPPSLIPEIFAPGIISINGRYEHGISFSPELDEVYFSANKKGGLTDIYFSKLENGKWKPVKKAKFTQGRKDEEMHPFVSLDGEKIYFTALNSDNTDTKIWYAKRLGNAWSKAAKLESPINKNDVFYSNLAKNGDLFYTNISKRKMYYSPNKNGKFPEVQELDIKFGIHGFISPSQDYLLVNARNKNEGRKDHDIYVYFKKKDGTWTHPINLGNSVNSKFNETVPSLTPDGKYLFFSRYNEEGGLSNFYWVSTKIIESLKPKL